MHIIIPMSGMGERFIQAGYSVPKPLIEVDGKPIIEHVVHSFPGEKKFTFICNSEHLAKTAMRKTLNSIVQNPSIVEVSPHKKGPVWAVLQVPNIVDDEPVIVNYCDFAVDWEYEEFKDNVGDSHGAVSCYTGFHPHLLHNNVYAGVLRTDEAFMENIKEKHCFTATLEQGWHSTGMYYFKDGKTVKHFFQKTLDTITPLNGEHYVSMVFYPMLEEGLRVYVPEVRHFCQWGTPKDLEEYITWSNAFKDGTFESLIVDENTRKTHDYWKNFFTRSNFHSYQGGGT